MTDKKVLLTLDVILVRIADYVKARKIKVANPHTQYFEKHFYVPQIKILGGIYYYQLPATAGSKIIAWWWSRESVGNLDFNRGYTMDDIRGHLAEGK